MPNQIDGWKKKLWSGPGRAEFEKLALAPWASRRRQELLELLDRIDPIIQELTTAAEQEARKRPEVSRLMTHPACAGLVIIYNALKQTKPALLELTDSAPEDPNVESRVRAIAASETGVIGLDKCHARKMGLSYYVDLHIIVSAQLTVWEGHGIAHSVEDAILKSLPQVSEVLVHLEPEEELTSHGAAPSEPVTKSR